MKLLIDNDVIQKLAVLDAFDAALGTVPNAGRFVLPSARFRFAKAGRKLGVDAAVRAENFAKACTPLPAEPPDVARYQHTPGIDVGEALLFATAAHDADTVLWTGDKRSLEALALEPNLKDVVDKLAGRVRCFEQIVLAMLDSEGFAWLLPRVVAAPDCDRSLTSVFGSKERSVEPSVREGLASYIGAIRAGALLRE